MNKRRRTCAKLLSLILMIAMLSACGAPGSGAASQQSSGAASQQSSSSASQQSSVSGSQSEPANETESASGEEKEPGTEAADEVTEEVFADWNQDAPALNALIDYMEAVTDESSADYIPPADRIAVFDMDGTLCGELYPTYLEYYMLAWRILKDPSFEPDEEMLAVGRTIRDCALDDSFPEDMAMQHAVQAARAYAGMTLTEFADFVTEFLLRDADGFEGMTYGEAIYRPMIEVVEYLQDNDFKVYVVSGSDRFICRTLLEGAIDIPNDQFIGMDVALEATGQDGTDGLDYVYTDKDDLVRTDELLIKNLKTNKVLQIAQEIGQQPVLSFGNSSGDASMHNYTINKNPYRSEAFMLVADDDARDYGDPKKGAELKQKWEDSGYRVISMKEDFRTIYGDDVKKTGSFRWAEELKEDREAADGGKSVSEDDPSGFVLLSEAVPDAILEIRYYSTYNFIGERVDGYEEPLAFLTKEAAAALKEVSDDLVEKGYRLKIFDAYRPQMAVDNFVEWAKDEDDTRMKEYFYPELDKDVLFPQGYIDDHSGHSRGSTVDLTLFDMKTEREVDMGGTFDYFGQLSHPDYTDITKEQYENRMILREAMLAHGFKPLEEEWWHFTLKNEPYPDAYFTFPVSSDVLDDAA